MLLTCPNCQTEYDVPDAALTGRSRTLRCDNCMTKWKVPALHMYREEPAVAESLPETDPAADALPETGETLMEIAEPPADTSVAEEIPVFVVAEPEVAETERVSLLKTSRVAEVPAPPQPSSSRALAISVLLVVLIVAAILIAHRPIGHFWPPSLRLFNALGLH